MTRTQPTDMEQHAAKNIAAPAKETPRYGIKAALTYLDPEGWFLIEDNGNTAFASDYPAALAAWEKAEGV